MMLSPKRGIMRAERHPEISQAFPQPKGGTKRKVPQGKRGRYYSDRRGKLAKKRRRFG